MFLLCFFTVWIGLFPLQTFAQTSLVKDSVINKEFWLKIPLPSDSECKIIISEQGILSPKDFCEYIYDTAVEMPVSNGTKIKILGFKKRPKNVEIKFSKVGDSFTTQIHLRSDAENLDKLFETVFSDKAVEEADDSMCKQGSSKMQILQCWGFPSSITKKGKREIYRYGLEFGGKIHGFDMATVEIEDNIVVSISGIV